MNHNLAIGATIKALRKEKKMTLKQLSEESELSVGFLSQLERGLSTIAIDSLSKIANILGVSLATFFQDGESVAADPVVRSFETPYTAVSPQIIQYILSNDVTGFDILPRIYQLMPIITSNGEDVNKLEMYSHSGEEFIYVLEGIVTVYVGGNKYFLYPQDSIQIHSTTPHNWINTTNRIAKLLTINFPNPFKEQHREENKVVIHTDEKII